MSALATNGVTITPVPAGISGHTSKDMLARLDRDVLSKKPDWMTLSCGVNDVWHGEKGVPLDQYKVNIASIVDQAQAAGIKIVILTSTPIGEDPKSPNNTKLADYNAFLAQLATQKNCLFADLGGAMASIYTTHPGPGHYLTADGVHPNPLGDQVMATGILKTFGLNDAQIATAKKIWIDIPGGWTLNLRYRDPAAAAPTQGERPKYLVVNVPLTIRQYEALDTKAKSQNTSESEIASKLLAADFKALLKPTGTYDSFDAIFDANLQVAVQTQLGSQLSQQVADQLKTIE